MHGKPFRPNQRSGPAAWIHKFACALRGIARAIATQNSLWVHLVATLVVVAAGMYLKVTSTEWLALVLCITLVLCAEMMNTGIEHLARAITSDEHPEVREALDATSGAVFVAALGACVVGVLVLL